MLPCLRRGPGSRLVCSVSQRGDDLRARLVRDDHVVDVAALGRRVRVGEVRLVVGDQLLAARVRGRRGGDVAAVDDVDRALGAHHRDLGRRPREVEVGEHVLGGHDVVGAAVGLARDDRDLRHGRLGVGVQQLGAVADDPAPLLVGPGQEARHVAERDQRDVERVAGAHEAAGLASRSRCRARRPAGWAGCRRSRPRSRPGARTRRRCCARSARGPRRTRRRRRCSRTTSRMS